MEKKEQEGEQANNIRKFSLAEEGPEFAVIKCSPKL